MRKHLLKKHSRSIYNKTATIYDKAPIYINRVCTVDFHPRSRGSMIINLNEINVAGWISEV